MNVDNENTEPVTDLALAVGYSNQCTQRRLNNDSGAGANAGSSDMTFVANDPLSELVWSPHKGLSLKCADCSFTNKKTSLLWGSGPSNVVLSPPQSITGGRSDKPMDEKNFITTQVTNHINSEVSGIDTTAKTPRSDSDIMPVCISSHGQGKGTGGTVEEINTAVGVSVLHMNQKEEDLRESKREGVCGPINIQMAEMYETRENKISSFPGPENERVADTLSVEADEPKADVAQIKPLSGDPSGIGKDDGNGSQPLGMEIVLPSEVHPKNGSQAPDIPVPDLMPQGRRDGELYSLTEEESKNKMKETDSSSVPPLEKLESTAENDLKAPTEENACGVVSIIVASESANEVKNSSQKDEVPVNHSPTNSIIHMNQRKGKEKALSGGDINQTMSKEEDDSHESAESCNTAGLLSTGKKRRFEYQLVVGSKRVKKKIQESPGSSSFIRQDSSFMNWISNMMKGFFKPNQDEAPSLPLTLGQPIHGHESPDQKLTTCIRNQGTGRRNAGFQSFFQSLYCPNTKVQETRTLDSNYQTREGYKEIESANKICDVTPVACHGENGNFCKQFLVSNEKLTQSRSGNGAGPSTQPQILSVNLAAIQENCKTNSAENRNSCNLEIGKEINGISSHSSLGKCKTNSAENIDSDAPPSEGRTTQNFGYRRDTLGSLWITRFYPKISGPLLNLDHSNQSTSGVPNSSTDCMRLNPTLQNCVGLSNKNIILEDREHSTEDPVIVVGKELQNCAAGTEASTSFNRTKSHNEQKSIYKSNPVLPSQRLKGSETMASVFARRLDALKHIIPSNVTDSAAPATTICFFCGMRGHYVRDCPEVTETELEDLLRNVILSDKAKESPCLCIRCFQVNHWAIECSSASRKLHQSECGALLMNHCSPSTLHPTGNEKNQKLLDSEECQFQPADAGTIFAGKILRIEADNNLGENITSDKVTSNSNSVKKYSAAGSGKNKLKDNQIMPLFNCINRQISDVPEGIFDAIKRLRLSRTDILKWMNSHISLSHLDGFFLRLRLGKWEGPGGTGYHVACITGSQRERSPKSAKNPLSVNVGGIKCLVESQYVSNQDFLEDELMVWWRAILKSGGKIPSKEDLKVKVEERKILGL